MEVGFPYDGVGRYPNTMECIVTVQEFSNRCICIFLNQCLGNSLIDMRGTCNITKFTFIGVFYSNSRRLSIDGSSKKHFSIIHLSPNNI